VSTLAARLPFGARIERFKGSYTAQILSQVVRDRLALVSLGILLFFTVIAVIGPFIAPYDPRDRLMDENGQLLVIASPSAEHLLGTTNVGRDIFSQLIVGTQAAFIIGGIAAIAEVAIAIVLGLVAGYYKGWRDNLLMRAVDVAYTLPVEPVAIVLLVFLGQSMWTVILAIVLLSWRNATRVLRTQVLSVSERAFVKGARVAGASDFRILFRHILPTILPIAIIYLPVGFGNAIVAEAAISFLGFGDPELTTWGLMLREVFDAGATQTAWWWIVAPGLCITVVVSSMFFLTRAFEDVLNPRLQKR